MRQPTTTLATALLGLSWGLLATSPAAASPEEAMNKAGCMACHAKDKKILGPSYKDMAAKYKGQDKAKTLALLADKVRQGGKGVWGPVPMPPNPASKISDADLGSALEWVLQQ